MPDLFDAKGFVEMQEEFIELQVVMDNQDTIRAAKELKVTNNLREQVTTQVMRDLKTSVEARMLIRSQVTDKVLEEARANADAILSDTKSSDEAKAKALVTISNVDAMSKAAEATEIVNSSAEMLKKLNLI